jgi:UDP-N-acetylglucosamine 4,6-dehydratase
MKITDLARAIAPQCKFKKIGIRPGEKMHEFLVSCDEARNTVVFKELYVILPQYFREVAYYKKYRKCPKVPKGFSFTSATNEKWLTVEGLRRVLKDI